MPRVEHIVETPYKPTFRTRSVEGSYDLTPGERLKQEWAFDFPYDAEPWQIGLICGPSGSGKTRVAAHVFGEDSFYHGSDWPRDGSFLEGFREDASTEDIFRALTSVGLSSPPKWLLPYSCLSNGQQFRVQLADALISEDQFIIIDEFTSIVDRTVAKIASHAFQKSVRKTDKKVVLLSCHYDVTEWLEPDWILDMKDCVFQRGSLRRPKIKLDVFECTKSTWEIFRDHHYLSHSLSRAAYCYAATYDGSICAFTSMLKFPHPKHKCIAREHRTVVLPDYQGVGIGNRLSEWVANHWTKKGYVFQSITSHPSMIRHRLRSEKWRCVRKPGHAVKGRRGKRGAAQSSSRVTATFQYISN